MNEITVKWYDRAEDIFLAYWSGLDPAVTLDELLDANAIVTGTGADGVDVDLPASEVLYGIKAQLVWGFSATKEPNASQFFTDKDKATKEQLEAFENAVLGAQAIRKGIKTARKTAGIYNQYYRQMNSGVNNKKKEK